MFVQLSEQIWISTNNLEESDNAGRGCRQESSVERLVTLKCLRCLQTLIFFFNYLWRRHHVQTWINIAIYAFVTSHVGECFNQKSITDDHFPPWPVCFSVFVPWRTNVSLSLCFRVVIQPIPTLVSILVSSFTALKSLYWIGPLQHLPNEL